MKISYLKYFLSTQVKESSLILLKIVKKLLSILTNSTSNSQIVPLPPNFI